MSAPRCKPGDLALVIKGRQTGKTVSVLRAADKDEVLEAIRKVLGIRFADVANQGQLWAIDLPITWSGMGASGKSCMVAFAPDDNLLPINPDQQIKQEHKKEEPVV